MRIGSGIGLLVIGAILAFAVNYTLAGINIALIGWILMIAGIILLIISLAVGLRGRSTSATSRTVIDPASGEQVTRTRRRDDFDTL